MLQKSLHKGELRVTEKLDQRTGEIISKPDCVIDYMENMRLLDKADMQITTILHKSIKRYKNNFYKLKIGRNVPQSQFHRELRAKILEHQCTLTFTIQGRKNVGKLHCTSASSFMELQPEKQKLNNKIVVFVPTLSCYKLRLSHEIKFLL